MSDEVNVEAAVRTLAEETVRRHGMLCWPGDVYLAEVIRAAEERGRGEERERLVAVFTSGEFCHTADHMQGLCYCEEMKATILNPAAP